MPTWETVIEIIGILVAIGFAISNRFEIKANVEKAQADTENAEADAAKKIQEASLALLQPLEEKVKKQGKEIAFLKSNNLNMRGEITTLKKQNSEMNDELSNLRYGLGLLIGQIEKAGLEPVFRPNSKNEQS